MINEFKQRVKVLTQNPERQTEVINWIDTALNAQLSKHPDKLSYSDIEHIVDYLISKEAPTRLRKMSVIQALKKSSEWLKSQVKKGANITETEEDIEVIKVYPNGFRFVKLVGGNAYKREGHLMSHCVGSYVGNMSCDIYSLRDTNNMPHCTMEVTKGFNNYVNQIKGKGNGPIHPKYVEFVLDMLISLDIDVSSNDMPNLGYHDLTEEFWNFLDNYVDGVKEITFKNKRYFYKGSNVRQRPGIKLPDLSKK